MSFPAVEPGDNDVLGALFFIDAPLFPQAMIPPLLAFQRLYCAARAIADNMALPAERKIAMLDDMIAAIGGSAAILPVDGASAGTLGEFVAAARAAGADPRHAGHMLQAFRQDAIKTRYRDWGEFLAHCRYAATPVARYALDMFGERTPAAQPAAEALCCAWRVIGCLQAASADYRLRDRVYLPLRWFKEHEAAVEDLGGAAATPALRRVFHDGTLAVGRLLDAAGPLPRTVRQRRLRGAMAANLHLARRFARRIAAADLVTAPPHIGNVDRAMASVYGLVRQWI